MIQSKIQSTRDVINTLVTIKKDITATDIMRKGYWQWARDSRTIKTYIFADMEQENLLKADVTKVKGGVAIKIKPKNLIRYMKKYYPILILNIKKYGEKNNSKKGKRSQSTLEKLHR